MKPIYITKVDLATIEDCLQVGEFARLTNYLIFLFNKILNGYWIVLQRCPINDEPTIYKVLYNFLDFKIWVNEFRFQLDVTLIGI